MQYNQPYFPSRCLKKSFIWLPKETLQHPYCLCFVKLRVVGTSSAPHCLNKKQLEKVWVWTIWAILLANYSIALLNIPPRAGTHLLSLSWALNVKTCISMSSLRPLQFQAYWFWPAQNQGRLGLLWWGNMGHSSALFLWLFGPTKIDMFSNLKLCYHSI